MSTCGGQSFSFCGNDFTGSGHSRDYSEQILDHSYNLTKAGLQDILPDKIDETDTSTFAGFRTARTKFDGTFEKITDAAKTVNLSHNARLTDYYQPPIEECYKLKPALEEKAKNGDKAAKYYLDKIKEIEECVQSRKNVSNILSPEETGFDVGREGPFYEVMENYVNSAREGEGKYQRIVEWGLSQGDNSYNDIACDHKMVVLHSMGYDVTDPKKDVNQIVDELSGMGYYVGEPRSSSLQGGSDHRNAIRFAIHRARRDPDSFKELCGTLVRYQAGVVLALEKTDFKGNDKSTRSVILMRTENGDIPGIKGKAIGEVCTHKPGIAESFSQHTTICVQGSELTMVRVPYSRINGFWFTHREKGSPMFFGDRENEFNVNANGLAAYLVEHDVSDSSSVEQFMSIFEKAEKEHKKKRTK